MVTDGGFLLLEKREVEHDDTFFMSEVELEQKEVEHDYADQSQYCGIKRILLKWNAFVLSFSFQILKIKDKRAYNFSQGFASVTTHSFNIYSNNIRCTKKQK
jgi:hypothetical protein